MLFLFQHPEIVALIITAFGTPLMTILVLFVKGVFSKSARVDKQQLTYIQELRTDRDTMKTEIKRINIALEKKDREYVKMAQAYDKLKDLHDQLKIDHEALKSKYKSLSLKLEAAEKGIIKSNENIN